MNWHRGLRITGLILLLMAGVSCSTSDGGLTGPATQSPQQPSALFGDLLGDVDGVVDGLEDTVDGTLDGLGSGDLDGTLAGAAREILEVTDLLTCTEQEYVAVTQEVGPKGARIKVGEHLLEIPKGALMQKVEITAEQMQGSTNSVRFSPEGLRFKKSAQLTMSYKNCLTVLLPKSIVYTTEKFKILEVLRSIDLFQRKKVSAPIDHFSRYAVAY